MFEKDPEKKLSAPVGGGGGGGYPTGDGALKHYCEPGLKERTFFN